MSSSPAKSKVKKSKIQELFNREQKYWKKENIELLGLLPVDQFFTIEQINDVLQKSVNLYWNVENPCLFAQKLINGELDKDYELRVENTFDLQFNPLNTCVDVFSTYKHKGKNKKLKVAAIPTVTNSLSWLIGNLHYTPRVTAKKNNFDFINRFSVENVVGENWVYNIAEDQFTIYNKDLTEDTLFENLSIRSKEVLKLVEKRPTKKNFRSILPRLPIIAANSVFNYRFEHLDYFKFLILNTNKYAKPTSNVLLGVNQIILAPTHKRKFVVKPNDHEGELALSDNKMFSLESFRTTVNVFNGAFKPTFSYVDTTGLFDSFKTVTTGQAGRQRLLLDDVIVKNGMLYVIKDNKEYSMYHFFFTPNDTRLSCLSEALFCNNDKPKRIMMNAKLSAQSCPLKDELDDMTHRVLARVGFADIEGYSYGDSIIISESFSKRLKTWEEDIVVLEDNDFKKIDINNIDEKALKIIYPQKHEAILGSWENIKIKRVEDYFGYKRIYIKYDIPFSLGDKITNLHGAKGTVGLILPDEQMPILMNKVGNMNSGPLEIIISGFSTMRRGSLGQIFEAWAQASGVNVDENSTLFYNYLEEYAEQMKEYAEKSIVSFRGEQVTMPVGLNKIMRVNHHAATHLSTSSRFSNKKLKFGEMEKLNLISNGCESILKELSYRDIDRHVGGFYLLNDLENYGKLPEQDKIVLQTSSLFKVLGYEIKIDEKNTEKVDLSLTDFRLDDLFNYEEEEGDSI